MNDNSEFDPLDRILAQPALIADRGFSERISTELVRESRKTISQRTKIFALAGFIWLALLITVASPLALLEDLYRLLTMIDLSEQLSILNSASSSIDYTALQTSYPIILGFGLSLAAVLNLLLKD